eukprot:1141801-Pelagomonas_calceolata.AAC.4
MFFDRLNPRTPDSAIKQRNLQGKSVSSAPLGAGGGGLEQLTKSYARTQSRRARMMNRCLNIPSDLSLDFPAVLEAKKKIGNLPQLLTPIGTADVNWGVGWLLRQTTAPELFS